MPIPGIIASAHYEAAAPPSGSYVDSSTFFDANTPKTVAVSWAAGELIIVWSGAGGANDILTAPTVAGLTFSLETEQDTATTTEPESHIWSAVAGSSGSGNISMSMSGATIHWGFSVWKFPAGATIGVKGSDLNEAVMSLAVSAGSTVVGGVADWNATAGSSAPATGSGTATERMDGQSGHWRYWTGEWAGTAAGSFGFGIASYSGLKIAQSFVEVKAVAVTLPAPLLAYDFSGSGTVALDQSGNGRDAVLLNSTTPATLQSGGRLLIPDVNRKLVYTPDAAALPQYASVTMKITTGSTPFDELNLWTKMRVANSSNFNIYVAGQTLSAVVRGTTVVGPSIIAFGTGNVGPTLAANTTYQVAVTYDGTITRMYLNGVETNTANTASGPLDMTGTNTTWVIGDHPDDTSVTPTALNFYIDDVRFFDVALTAAQVALAAITPVTPAPRTRGFTNHVAIAGPRNGTTTHIVDPSSGTVAAGSSFTPTAGRFLLCVVYGAFSSTTPSGWTLPTSGSALNNGGLYVFYKASAAGGDSLTTTHNGSNFPGVFDFYEFPAGTTFVASVAATGLSDGGANPNLTGLTGTNFVMAAKGFGANGGSAASGVWGSPTVEATDYYVPKSGTDGYWIDVGYIEGYASASYQPTCTATEDVGSTAEALTWAINVPAPTAPIFTEAWNSPDAANWDFLRWPHQRPFDTIVGGKGMMATGGSPTQVYADQYVEDFEMTVKMTWPSSIGGQYPEIAWRIYDGMGGSGQGSGYVIQVHADGSSVELYRVGAYTYLTNASASILAAGSRWWKVRVVGHNHKVKWWDDGSGEPGTWNIDYTDASPQVDSAGNAVVGGTIGFRYWGATQIWYDDLTITDLATPPTPPDGSLRMLSHARVNMAGNANVFNIDTDLTWCCWFKTTSLALGCPVMSLFNGGSNYCITTLQSDGVLRQYMSTGDFNSGTTLSINTWYFIALSRSITGGSDLYWAPQGTATLNKVHSASIGVVTGQPLRLLSDEYGSSPYEMGCAFKVWKEALTQAQLEAEMATYSAVRTTNLFASWPMRNGMDWRSENPVNNNLDLYWETGGIVSGPKPTFLT